MLTENSKNPFILHRSETTTMRGPGLKSTSVNIPRRSAAVFIATMLGGNVIYSPRESKASNAAGYGVDDEDSPLIQGRFSIGMALEKCLKAHSTFNHNCLIVFDLMMT